MGLKGGEMDSEEILRELKEERRKYPSNEERMKELCNLLIDMGVYPKTSQMGHDAYKMVTFYGVNWHTFEEPHFCRHCKADLRDHVHGPPGKREIGIYDRGLDRTVEYRCPDCKKAIWALKESFRD